MIILDLSSPSSSTSESDHKSAHSSLHYNSTEDKSRGIKLQSARCRRKAQNALVKCNSKIRHFLQKYAGIHLRKFIFFNYNIFIQYYTTATINQVVKALLDKLNLKRDGLYNFLKYIRNTKDAANLGLNSINVISVLTDIFQKEYLNHGESYDSFMYLSCIYLYF
jgi:hypothetical protein